MTPGHAQAFRCGHARTIFYSCVEAVAAHAQERRTQLFSATMTSKVAKLQRACLKDPVKVEADAKYQTVSTLKQQFLFIPFKFKVSMQASEWMFLLFPSSPRWGGRHLNGSRQAEP